MSKILRTIGQAARAWQPSELRAAGLDDRFVSQRVEVNGHYIHAVMGGQGNPLVLLPGWPQKWYAWRHTMNELADAFTVIAIDPKGFGSSDAPIGAYDTATVADELAYLIQTKLGHRACYLVGHDVGAWIAYSLAARHRDLINAVGICEAVVPGLVESPPLFLPEAVAQKLWHFAFNRVHELNELLVRGNERAFLRYQFDTKSHRTECISDESLEVYTRAILSSDHLRASFDYYRSLDKTIEQNKQLKQHKLTLPVLAIGGEYSLGKEQERSLRTHTTNVTGRVIQGVGHYPAEENPEVMTATLLDFFLS